ncbi:hypothetical protein N657DRAFT_640385 [Parathielavia appendiculata]|uniref:Uncharacterized protein n=1 Tax=Parathielavia appendiculata TaxID=2587402 RepID=A0AAN6UB42_9PEZI|nr:hypothetical protein N657DRAFT_640385 [Parathielavia appendiculata]
MRATEIDGYTFGSGLDALQSLYDDDPNLRGLIPPITYLIRNTVFQPRYNAIERGRFSLSIGQSLCLAWYSSDDPRAAGVLADYGASWETVSRKLVTFSL